MNVLVRGDLKTRETEIVGGPREESFRLEADRLNQRHYERCLTEMWGKVVEGFEAPFKRHIWFDEEVPDVGELT